MLRHSKHERQAFARILRVPQYDTPLLILILVSSPVTARPAAHAAAGAFGATVTAKATAPFWRAAASAAFTLTGCMVSNYALRAHGVGMILVNRDLFGYQFMNIF